MSKISTRDVADCLNELVTTLNQDINNGYLQHSVFLVPKGTPRQWTKKDFFCAHFFYEMQNQTIGKSLSGKTANALAEFFDVNPDECVCGMIHRAGQGYTDIVPSSAIPRPDQWHDITQITLFNGAIPAQKYREMTDQK